MMNKVISTYWNEDELASLSLLMRTFQRSASSVIKEAVLTQAQIVLAAGKGQGEGEAHERTPDK